MNTILVDAEGRAGSPAWRSPRTMTAVAIVAASLALSALGLYWLSDGRSPAGAAPAADSERPAAAAAEPAIAAPEPSCIDGKPAREGVSADSCI